MYCIRFFFLSHITKGINTLNMVKKIERKVRKSLPNTRSVLNTSAIQMLWDSHWYLPISVFEKNTFLRFLVQNGIKWGYQVLWRMETWYVSIFFGHSYISIKVLNYLKKNNFFWEKFSFGFFIENIWTSRELKLFFFLF